MVEHAANLRVRRLSDNTELRATANRRTTELLQERGLIGVAKPGGVLDPTVWCLTSRHRERLLMTPEEREAMECRFIEINRRLGILAPLEASDGASPELDARNWKPYTRNAISS